VPNDAVTWVEAPPAPDAYARLRAAVGWDERPPDAVAAGLQRALYSVCGYEEDALVACGRVVGDGALYFYIQDVIVLPARQKNGLGRVVMDHIERYLSHHAPSNAFVGLMAAAGAAAFYRRYGYEPRPPDRPGMFKIVARRRDH
jgi:GNAT superfamily N-acetyltransferase